MGTNQKAASSASSPSKQQILTTTDDAAVVPAVLASSLKQQRQHPTTRRSQSNTENDHQSVCHSLITKTKNGDDDLEAAAPTPLCFVSEGGERGSRSQLKRYSKSSVGDYFSKSPIVQMAVSTLSRSSSTNSSSAVMADPAAAGIGGGGGQDAVLGQHQHGLLLREDHVSLDEINPHPTCRTRKSSALIAVINLVATVCGGGVLSLPLAFRRAGILPTTMLMIFGAVITDFALLCLVDAARKSGGRSYGDVASAAFGSFAQVITTFTLALMLCGTLIAYQVLVKDIWTPVVFFLLSQFQERPQHDGSDIVASHTTAATPQEASVLLACIVLLSLPLSLKTDLHALRHTCYVGFGSCVLLMIAVVYRACQKLQTMEFRWTDNSSGSMHTSVSMQSASMPKIKWWTDNPADLLFAFPIVVLCYFCSFNVLAVHSQLVNPSRNRIRYVLGISMSLCCVIFFGVGLCGYLYTMDGMTPDNILLAFDLNDQAILAGRVGFCLTLLFGMPLVLLPCREAIISLPAQIRAWRRDAELVHQFRKLDETYKETHRLLLAPPEQQQRNGNSTSCKYYGTSSEITASGHLMGSPHLVINGVDFDGNAPILVKGSSQETMHHGTAILPVIHDDVEALFPLKGDADDTPTTSTTGSMNESSSNQNTADQEEEEEEEEEYCIAHNQMPLLHSNNNNSTESSSSSAILALHEPIIHIVPQGFDNKKFPEETLIENSGRFAACLGVGSIQHVAITLTIVSYCYVVAIMVPGVAIVWSIVGSSLAVWIAFVVPTACFLRIRLHKGLTNQALYAWLLLALSVIAMVVCTKQAVHNALSQ